MIRAKSSPKEFFISENIRPRKGLGQSFIHDQTVLYRILEIAELSEEDEVIEIGAGLGALTLLLGEKSKRVIAIEKDDRLLEKLKQKVSNLNNVEIISGDALQINLREFHKNNKIKVVSNLPYIISSPILFRLLEERDIFSLLVLMLQREVGERICALPGSKLYGSISVLIQTYMDTSIELNVPPEAFWPKPKVWSVVIKLIPLKSPRIYIPDEKLFKKIIRAAFSTRRKMLLNSLCTLFPKEKVKEILNKSDIDGKRRAESLTIDEFGKLTISSL
ncbi:MAG TPA: 16S rRNA (adenine(1518)-N(6)/adenine(1519)-N(6))-dimethyltransferase RsmA [Thermodesulfobacteriota bacterium]|jgi:16S rRNA (adenine1518-N6/adenine1519-N6)-dimethyltransferase